MGLKYYAVMKNAPSSDILRHANIKNENKLVALSDSRWEYYPKTGRSTGAYMIFYQCVKVYYGTHVPVSVSQSSVDSEYNTACTAGMALAYFRMLTHDFWTNIQI